MLDSRNTNRSTQRFIPETLTERHNVTFQKH